ncbi:MAG: ATP-binding protein [Burkholderiaceae bacterium]
MIPRSEAQHPSDVDEVAGLKNMQQLIELRWIAVLGQIGTILIVRYGFDIALPLDRMLAALACLTVFNVFSLLRVGSRHQPFTASELFIALLVDVATLTVQLYLSGGATNPFIFLYLLQIGLGAILLEPAFTWALIGVTLLCFIGVATFHLPLPVPRDHELGLGDPYTLGLLLCFTLNAVLLVLFLNRISRNLRTRDARLADLRRRAVEEEHIVRMGLLASGAAHELGTPLATLSVILGDWRRLPVFRHDAQLRQEIDEMQTELTRCKDILTGILRSAGEARGDEAAVTTISRFVGDLVAEWRSTRSPTALMYTNTFGDDLPIALDATLKQMIHNVLDNALEASPSWVGLQVTRDDDQLVLTVTDDGPGFSPELIERLGQPYQSTKGRPGSGLGLFLSTNVARTLGGSLQARNRPEGGALVRITLPLAAIRIDADLPPERLHHVDG